MRTDLYKLITRQKSGTEPIRFNDLDTGFELIDFWRWSVSDILSNATRGRFAEFIVASALNIDLTAIRDEWSAYDLTSPEGIKVEVKSASYLQSWFQSQLSKIAFSIKPARFWDSSTNRSSKEATRESNVYVFCLLKHQDKKTVDPLRLEQWEFYVLPTSRIEQFGKASSISLNSLKKVASPVTYQGLRQAILSCYGQ